MFEATELGTRSDRVEQLMQHSKEARGGVDDKGGFVRNEHANWFFM